MMGSVLTRLKGDVKWEGGRIGHLGARRRQAIVNSCLPFTILPSIGRSLDEVLRSIFGGPFVDVKWPFEERTTPGQMPDRLGMVDSVLPRCSANRLEVEFRDVRFSKGIRLSVSLGA